jgi:hypothetical protein
MSPPATCVTANLLHDPLRMDTDAPVQSKEIARLLDKLPYVEIEERKPYIAVKAKDGRAVEVSRASFGESAAMLIDVYRPDRQNHITWGMTSPEGKLILQRPDLASNYKDLPQTPEELIKFLSEVKQFNEACTSNLSPDDLLHKETREFIKFSNRLPVAQKIHLTDTVINFAVPLLNRYSTAEPVLKDRTIEGALAALLSSIPAYEKDVRPYVASFLTSIRKNFRQ